MRRIFKLKGEGLLTLRDLQESFDPWEIYGKREDFLSFVEIHSKLLPVKVAIKEEGGESVVNARYIKKEFWLNDVLNAQRWPQAERASEQMQLLAMETIVKALGVRDKYPTDGVGTITEEQKKEAVSYNKTEKDLKDEYSGLRIEAKLQHIIESAGLDEKEDARTAIELLAICELSEVDALKQSFEKPNQNPDGNGSNPNPNPDNENPIVEFPRVQDGTLYLEARTSSYKYWYHSSDVLQDGETIQTVKIHAQANRNAFLPVKIELYDDETEQCVHTLSLTGGEYRYCNAAGGKVIKFLPTIAISSDAYLYRKNDNGIAECEDGQPERQLMDEKMASRVSSFAIIGRNNFVLIQNGKLQTLYYLPAQNYGIRTNMAIITNAVEIQLTDNGYKVLKSDGSIVTNIEGEMTAQRVVSLDNCSRYPLPTCSLRPQGSIEEISVGSRRNCIMIRCKNAKDDVIYFGSAHKRVAFEGNAQSGIRISVR